MDMQTLGPVIAIVKAIPGTAAQRAETAAAEAKASAAIAATHNYGISVSDHKLTITAPEGGN